MSVKNAIVRVTLVMITRQERMILMTPEMSAKLKRSVVNHEGRKKFPYPDTLGNITLGIGYNLTARGITDEWIDNQYSEDAEFFYLSLSQYPWFNNLNEDRKIVLLDMCFMGLKKFLTFEKMIEALKESDFMTAAHEMINSKWAEQVKDRAFVLAVAMRKGVYDV